MSQYAYSNAVENFEAFTDTGALAKNLKNHEIGEALLGLSVPILTKASEKAIGSWMSKRAHNLKVRTQRAGQGEADEGEVDDPVGDTGDIQMTEITHAFDNPTFEAPLFEAPGVYTGEFVPAAAAGEWAGAQPVLAGIPSGVQADVIVPRGAVTAEGAAQPQGYNLARAWGARGGQPTQEAAPQLEAAAAQQGETAAADLGEGAVAAGGEAAGAAVGGTLETLAAETSIMPEVSSVLAVGGLIVSGVVSLIDIFKNSHVPAPLEALPQIGI